MAKILNALESEISQQFPSSHAISLSILLTTNEAVRELNLAYRKLDKTTDVLSFAALEGPTLVGSEASLGDIVIALPLAAVQARRYRTTYEQELLRLLIHGILHLLGYDHVKVSPAKARLMRTNERALARKFRADAASFS